MLEQLAAALLTHPLLLQTVRLAEDYSYGSDSGEGGAYFWLLGPLGGIGFYMWVYTRYRNTDKRHAYEHETAAEVLELRTHDQKVDEVHGTERRSIPGVNSNSPRTRLGQGTRVTGAS